MHRIIHRAAAIFVATALIPLAALAQTGDTATARPFGHAAPLSSATRTVSVTPDTRNVTVEQGDIVRFDIDGTSLVWQFDTLDARSFDFAAIAPSAAKPGRIRVYVRENPLYRN